MSEGRSQNQEEEKSDQYFMKMALDLAKMGQGFTSPNPVVGAVVVKDGKVVGRGYHKKAGEAHAEVNAIYDGGNQVKEGTLFVTLEPCNHTGRTPPCTQKILGAGIKRVVVAMCDPNPDVTGGGIDFLRKQGINVTIGVCENEAKKINEAYIKYVRTKRPFVIVKCAATLDGRIATRTGDSRWVSGEESRKFVHRLRHAADAIMVGIDTVKKDNPALTTRLNDIKGLDSKRVILDTRLSIPEDAMVLHSDSDSETIIITGNLVSDSALVDKIARIEKKGAGKGIRIIESPVKNGLIDLDLLMDCLGDIGITNLLIEGGGRVIASALKAGIVDKINFFYAPKILAGDDGVPVCKGSGPAFMDGCIRVKDISVKRFDDDVMIEGYVD